MSNSIGSSSGVLYSFASWQANDKARNREESMSEEAFVLAVQENGQEDFGCMCQGLLHGGGGHSSRGKEVLMLACLLVPEQLMVMYMLHVAGMAAAAWVSASRSTSNGWEEKSMYIQEISCWCPATKLILINCLTLS